MPSRWPERSGWTRRLRVRFATLRSGGFGARPGGITTALQGACWTGIDCDGDIALRVPGSADPRFSDFASGRIAKPQVERREACALRKARAAFATRMFARAFRRSAPLDFMGSAEWECRRARALPKNRDASARANLSPPHPEEHRAAMRLEGSWRPILRDAQLCCAPQDEAEKEAC